MSLHIDKKQLQFRLVEGVAFGVKHSSETVHEQKYSVLANGKYLATSQKEETSFWVKGVQGQEHSISLHASLEMRDGQEIRVVYAKWAHEHVAHPVAVENRTMNTLYRRDIEEVLTCLSIRLRSDSGCGGALFTLFTLFGAPILGGIMGGERGATVAFLLALCAFIPYLVIPPYKAKKRRQVFADELEDELRRVLSTP